MLKILYSIFIGILVATFVGLGIAAFYPAPAEPDYPQQGRELEVAPAEEESDQYRAELAEYDRLYAEYDEANALYNRNVSMLVVTVAVAILVLSLTVAGRMAVIADGLLLGGVFSLIYGIGRSFAAGDTRITFLVVTVGLLVAVVVGYIKFVKSESKKAS